MNNFNKIKNRRIYLSYNGSKTYAIGSYHECVKTAYIYQDQFENAAKKLNCRLEDVESFNNPFKVQIVNYKDGRYFNTTLKEHVFENLVNI